MIVKPSRIVTTPFGLRRYNLAPRNGSTRTVLLRLDCPSRVFGLAALLVGALLWVGGCDDPPQIVVQDEPIDPRPKILIQRDAQRAAQQANLVWHLPRGWQHVFDRTPMRYATIRTSADEDAVTITVSKLGAQAGGVLANVNRWRDQLGLDPIGDAELGDAVTPLQNPVLEGALADVTAPDKKTVVGIFPTAAGTWFFKMTDTPQRVDEQMAGFLLMLGSVHPDHPGHADHADHVLDQEAGGE